MNRKAIMLRMVRNRRRDKIVSRILRKVKIAPILYPRSFQLWKDN